MIDRFLIEDGDVHRVDIFSASDEELMEISREMGLALSLDEMKLIRRYFEKGSASRQTLKCRLSVRHGASTAVTSHRKSC